MKLSIVIPAYNEEAVIAQCLGSVFASIAAASLAEDECEVIVVNNASTDRTGEIARQYKNVRVVDEPRKGLTRARQAGFLASCGELVANPDADTLMPQQWVTTVLREFAHDKKLLALSGPYIYYDLPRFSRGLVKAFNTVAYGTYLLNFYVLRVGAMIQGGNFVVRRSALETIGGYDTSIEFYGEDTDIARRLSRKGKVKWTWKLYMYSSGRRLAEEGIVTTGVRYAANYVATTFRGKPLTKTHRDIRSKTD